MNNFKTREKEKLNEFCDYLTNVAKLSESTSNDYCKRIMTICSEEGIEIDDLYEMIETLCYEYTDGSKKEKGARSHNSYRGSILKFKDYLEWAHAQQSTTTDKKYLAHLCNSKINKSLVGVAEMIDTSTGEVVSVRTYTKEEVEENGSKAVMKMVWDMTFDALIKDKNVHEIASILSSLNISLEVEDQTTKVFKKFF